MENADVKIFDYWNIKFKIYKFNKLAEEVNITNCSERVFVVLDGSVVVVDFSDNRNEFTESEGFTLKNQNNYIIRSSSESANLLSMEKK
jgi:hypothetical protein